VPTSRTRKVRSPRLVMLSFTPYPASDIQELVASLGEPLQTGDGQSSHVEGEMGSNMDSVSLQLRRRGLDLD
jgi:hypothetical protein